MYNVYVYDQGVEVEGASEMNVDSRELAGLRRYWEAKGYEVRVEEA